MRLKGTLDFALSYAGYGIPVFPLHPIRNEKCGCTDPTCDRAGKHPLTKNGLKDATTDEKQIRSWWKKYPEAGIGGVPTVHAVVDLDPRNGGFKTLQRFEEDHGELPMDVVAETGESSGVRGQHRWFRIDSPMSKKVLGEGFDLITGTGFVVMPPSEHLSGVDYRWRRGSDLRDAPLLPSWVIDLTTAPKSYLSGERSGLKLSPRAYRFKVEGAAPGTQRLEAVAVSRALWGAGYSLEQAIEWIAEGLIENCEHTDEPWTYEEVEQIVQDVYSKPPPPTTKEGYRTYDFTDEGNAHRYVEEFGEVLRFVPQLGSWFYWDGMRWMRDVGGERVTTFARRLIEILEEESGILPEDTGKGLLRWLRATRTGRKIPLLVEKSQTLKPCPARVETFDNDPYLVNCRNGVLDLRTGELQDHNRNLYQRKILTVEYNPKARSKIFGKFLREVTLDDTDVEEFLQRVFGYSLTGSIEAHKLFFLFGPPATGKTTFLEAFRSIMGPYSAALPSDVFTKRGQQRGTHPEIASLPGTRFVTTSELEQGETFADAFIADLTGGGTIMAREMYGHPFEFFPQFKLFIAANHSPTIRSIGSGIWRRLVRIPFDNIIPESSRDPAIARALATTEREAVLAWAVEGCVRWHESDDRMFERVPFRVEESKQEYISQANRFAPFFSEEVEFTTNGDSGIYRSRDLYDYFQGWCDHNGIKTPLTMRAFAEELKDRGAVKEDRGGVAKWGGIHMKSKMLRPS